MQTHPCIFMFQRRGVKGTLVISPFHRVELTKGSADPPRSVGTRSGFCCASWSSRMLKTRASASLLPRRRTSAGRRWPPLGCAVSRAPQDRSRNAGESVSRRSLATCGKLTVVVFVNGSTSRRSRRWSMESLVLAGRLAPAQLPAPSRNLFTAKRV